LAYRDESFAPRHEARLALGDMGFLQEQGVKMPTFESREAKISGNISNTQENATRYILVQHNYVNRQFTTTKTKKSRRVDLSRQLRRALLELRDQRLLKAFTEGKTSCG